MSWSGACVVMVHVLGWCMCWSDACVVVVHVLEWGMCWSGEEADARAY